MIRALYIILAVVVLAACETDTYETGDGKYSYLRAEFAMVKTSDSKKIVSAETDDSEILAISPAFTCEWAEKGDTTYRALIYINKVESAKTNILSVAQVPVLFPHSHEEVDTVGYDPLDVESAWLSHNGRFANLRLAIKTGTPDDPGLRQTIALAADNITDLGNGNTRYYVTLRHNQNGVPEYYTSNLYVSIPTDKLGVGDEMSITVNTYKGKREFLFVIPSLPVY